MTTTHPLTLDAAQPTTPAAERLAWLPLAAAFAWLCVSLVLPILAARLRARS